MLGGVQAFRALVASAAARGLAVTVQLNACVSATRAHRRYKDLYVHIINGTGMKVAHPGTDGKANQWEDQSLLNYRKLDTWNLLVEEVCLYVCMCVCVCVCSCFVDL